MNQKLGYINDQMGKMVALQCSVDNFETLKDVFRLAPLAPKVKFAFHCMVFLVVMKPPVIFATCYKSKLRVKIVSNNGFQTRVLIAEVSPGITLNSIILMTCCLFSVTNRIAFFMIFC